MEKTWGEFQRKTSAGGKFCFVFVPKFLGAHHRIEFFIVAGRGVHHARSVTLLVPLEAGMSNEIHVSRTRFETLDEAGNVISTTYGARIYDDLGCTYVNLHKTLDELLALDAAELVEYVKHHSEMGAEILSASDFSRLFVDDEWVNEPPASEEPIFP